SETIDTTSEIKSYKVRWLILIVASLSATLRSFCQSCFSQISNVLARLLKVQLWQIDWLVVNQSICFILLTLPIAWITEQVGFRKSFIIVTGLLILGVSVERGYYLLLLGQVLLGCNITFGYAVLPLVSSIWFPSNEVASAIAIQFCSRGIGEALGSFTTPLLVNIHQSNAVVSFRLTMLFVPFVILSVVSLLVSYAFVPDSPPLPPSLAQMKKQIGSAKIHTSILESLRLNFFKVKALFSSPSFVVITTATGLVNPVFRVYTILLSSMLRKEFAGEPGLNQVSGYLLSVAWIFYTIAALLTGPVIAKTKKYRAILAFSAFIQLVAQLSIVIGMRLKLRALIYPAVLLLGAGAGMTETSLTELSVEITYPLEPSLVSSVNLIAMGCFRLIYSVVSRALLDKYGATASTLPEPILVTIGFILIISIPMRFKRMEADTPES
uniref:Major facilitator superfamily (MFS) profile domain-containing protein n=1 Tax=Ciona intestinalis TaxID=7719 RepID=H2XSH5_CIOIN